jgi:hypothetical protein
MAYNWIAAMEIRLEQAVELAAELAALEARFLAVEVMPRTMAPLPLAIAPTGSGGSLMS